MELFRCQCARFRIIFCAQTSVYGCWHAHPCPRLQNIDSQRLSWRVRKGGGGGGGDGCSGWGLQRLQQKLLAACFAKESPFPGDGETNTQNAHTNKHTTLPKHRAHTVRAHPHSVTVMYTCAPTHTHKHKHRELFLTWQTAALRRIFPSLTRACRTSWTSLSCQSNTTPHTVKISPPRASQHSPGLWKHRVPTLPASSTISICGDVRVG